MDSQTSDDDSGQSTVDLHSPVAAEWIPSEFLPTPSASDPVSSGSTAKPRMGLVAGSGAHLTEETQSLLRIRLSAIALTMTCAFGAFLVRNLWIGGRYLDPLLVVLHSGVVAVFLGSFIALSSRGPMTLKRLRSLELVLFAMTVAFFVTTHYRIVQLQVADGDRVMVMATVKNTVIFVFAMIVLYGMFIPNTWRRAAVVVFGMLAATAVSPLVMSVLHPDVFRFLKPILTFEIASESLLMLAIGAGTTVYATRVMNSLRVEAFEARRLNQYHLKEKIGSGGMGVVFLAEHQLLRRPCAVKLIAPDRAGDPGALARFEREVRTTATLSHPNTVDVYDYGRTEDGTFFYVMELLKGLSLEDLVARHGPLPPGRVVFLLRQACGALAEAHAAGLVHRDLKPANIFASRRGNLHDFVKLLDFGLVLPRPDPSSNDSSIDGRIAGSPPYMAPEQASGETRPNARTDIYGLGAVAYYLLTGRPPFTGRTAIAVLIAVARDPVEPPSKYIPDLPADLEQILMRCLAKSPAERYADVEALDRDLAACASVSDWNFAVAEDWWRSQVQMPSSVG